MATDDSKKIKELLEIINNKVGKLEASVSIHTSTMHVIKDQQSVMNEKLDDLKTGLKEVNENVDAARGDIEQVHDDVKGIRDKEGLFHSRNKREIDEIKTHLRMPLIADIPEA